MCLWTIQIPLPTTPLLLFSCVFTVAGQIYTSALHLTSSPILIRLPVAHLFTHGHVYGREALTEATTFN